MTRTGRERATVSCGSAVGVNRAIVRVLNVYTHRFFPSSFFHTLGGARTSWPARAPGTGRDRHATVTLHAAIFDAKFASVSCTTSSHPHLVGGEASSASRGR